TAALKTQRDAQRPKKAERSIDCKKKAKRAIECNGYIEGAKATGWKQAINQLAVAYPPPPQDYL
ncbi:IS256 family transposase, partial [Corynebacterium belfantii]|nr:IS256 family transposase [Corynebacterium belfantii]